MFWVTEPKERMTDIAAIRYTNNLRVADDGYGNPDAEMHLRYKYITPMNETEIDNQYNGSDSVYNHKLGEYFAFETPLPCDLFDSIIKYSNFYVSLEIAFDTNFSNLTGTEIQSYYGHQTKGETIDISWGLSFSVPPAIGFSIGFDKDKTPIFETPLFRSVSIIFDDAWLSRC